MDYTKKRIDIGITIRVIKNKAKQKFEFMMELIMLSFYFIILFAAKITENVPTQNCIRKKEEERKNERKRKREYDE